MCTYSNMCLEHAKSIKMPFLSVECYVYIVVGLVSCYYYVLYSYLSVYR